MCSKILQLFRITIGTMNKNHESVNKILNNTCNAPSVKSQKPSATISSTCKNSNPAPHNKLSDSNNEAINKESSSKRQRDLKQSKIKSKSEKLLIKSKDIDSKNTVRKTKSERNSVQNTVDNVEQLNIEGICRTTKKSNCDMDGNLQEGKPSISVQTSNNRTDKDDAPQSSKIDISTKTSSDAQGPFKMDSSQIFGNIVKSESDSKEYKVIRLSNGLMVCLISSGKGNEVIFDSESSAAESELSERETDGEEEDSDVSSSSSVADEKSDEEKMAAAALCVNVGSFSDPKKYPGMAHFLEHMVFMGSAKYPEENDFDSYLSKRGGSDNASTDCEATTFYFECLEKHFYKALDKFAQFFIDPLMKREAMTREREAIESEFQMALPSDVHCKEQLLASLSQPNCPVNSFGWGNLITLRDNVNDDELYKAVHEFRKRHYSAHRMTLVLQSKQSLEVLQNYAVECFSGIPTNNLPPDDFSMQNNVFNTPEFNRIYYVKPINNLRQVELRWALPPLLNKYKSKPHHYVSWLLGDEGKGSLLSYLRKKVWVLGMSTGNGESGFEYNSMYALFTITMTLTVDGLRNLREVIEAVFSYLKMLRTKGPNKRIFDEMQLIENISFRFSEEQSAVEWVEDIAESMLLYPPEDYITGSRLLFEYNPQDIEMVLQSLVPSKMNIMILCNNPDIKYDKLEKWFNSYYTDSEIPSNWIESWEKAKIHSDFAIPPPNIYLSTKFDILPEKENHPEYPEKVIHTNKGELWYRQDQKFKLPLAYYNFILINPEFLKDAKNLLLVDFFVNLLYLVVVEEAYPAQIAELSYIFKSYEKGIIMKVSGYNEKLPNLIDLISKHLVQFNTHITRSMFEAVKDKLIKNYYNTLLKPSTLAKDIRLKVLVREYFSVPDKYNVLHAIQLQHVQWFWEKFFSHLYVKMLVQGNVEKEHAIQTFNSFVSKMKYQPIDKSAYPKFHVYQLPQGDSRCRVESFNSNDPNSIITNYYQAGPYSVESSVIIEIILLLIQEPLFDTLRTKEQLGYHVYCTVRETYGVLGYTITVNAQTMKHNTTYVDERIEAFIKQATNLLESLTEPEFEKVKKNLINVKNITDVHLREEVGRNWVEIVDDDYFFDRLKKEIQAIQKLKVHDVIQWWKQHNCCNQEHFKKLSIQVEGMQSSTSTKKPKDKDIDDKKSSIDHLVPVHYNYLLDSQTSKSLNIIADIESYKTHLSLFSLQKK